MKKENKTETVVALLESGYPLEIISSELGIPLDEIKKLQNSIEIRQSRILANRTRVISGSSFSKMQDIRKRYLELYYGDKDAKYIKRASVEESLKIDSEIHNIEELFQLLENSNDVSEISNIIKRVYSSFDRIKVLPANVFQSEIICNFFRSPVFISSLNKTMNNSKSNKNTVARKIYNGYKRKSLSWFVDSLKVALFDCVSIEELKQLSKMATIKFESEDPISYSSVRARIRKRMLELEAKQKQIDIIEKMSPELNDVISAIAIGNVDHEKANQVIEVEKEKIDTKSSFNSMSDKTKKEKVFLAITLALREFPDKYPIQNPSKTVRDLSKIMGCSIDYATQLVVDNLISLKKFSQAKDTCMNFEFEEKDYIIKRRFESLKTKVELAEIGDIILKGIMTNGSIDEERRYIELIENGLNKANVDLKKVSLGKSRDGRKEITLDDIWTERTR